MRLTIIAVVLLSTNLAFGRGGGHSGGGEHRSGGGQHSGASHSSGGDRHAGAGHPSPSSGRSHSPGSHSSPTPSHYHDRSPSRGSHFHAGSHSSNYASGVTRDSHGRIARSAEARDQFKRSTGYAQGRPGYVIDHIIPLKKGGADVPSNMQWQTKEEAKAKDRWE